MTTLIPLSHFEGACTYSIAIVRREWPDGIPITEETSIRVVELGLDSSWAAEKLLPDAEFAEFSDVRHRAKNDYLRVMDQGYLENSESWESLHEYYQAQAQALDTYNRALAQALLPLLIKAYKTGE